MKVELFPFQKQALANLRLNTAEALGSYRRTHTPQIVSYTAPTGAGKTIVMSSLLRASYLVMIHIQISSTLSLYGSQTHRS